MQAIKYYFLYFLNPLLPSNFALVFRWIASARLFQKITRAKTGEPCTSTQKAQTY